MNFRRRRKLLAVLLALSLTGAQWLLGRASPATASASLCGAGACFAPETFAAR